MRICRVQVPQKDMQKKEKQEERQKSAPEGMAENSPKTKKAARGDFNDHVISALLLEVSGS